jgi:hypothetical protein
VWFVFFREDPDRIIRGSTVTGIRQETTGNGIKVTGRAHRMRELAGMLLVMTVANIIKVTGKETVAGLSTSTAGIMTGTGTIEINIMNGTSYFSSQN